MSFYRGIWGWRPEISWTLKLNCVTSSIGPDPFPCPQRILYSPPHPRTKCWCCSSSSFAKLFLNKWFFKDLKNLRRMPRGGNRKNRELSPWKMMVVFSLPPQYLAFSPCKGWCWHKIPCQLLFSSYLHQPYLSFDPKHACSDYSVTILLKHFLFEKCI